MEENILNAYSQYLEPYYGPIGEEMKKTITNIVAIVRELGFFPSKMEGKPGEINIELLDSIKKDEASHKTLGSISVVKDSASVSYSDRVMNDGIPHESYCSIGVMGDAIRGHVHKPTLDFEDHIVTYFNEEGIVTTKADDTIEVIPYISDNALTRLKEVFNVQTFKLDAINAMKLQTQKKQM